MAHHKVNKNNYKVSLLKVQKPERQTTDARPLPIVVGPRSLTDAAAFPGHKEDCIRVYTDASYSIETGIGVTSFVVTRNDEQIYSQSYTLNDGRGSTFAELVAIDRALDYVYTNICPQSMLELYTDSKMSVNIIERKVKLKQSKREYHRIVNNIRSHDNIRFVHVKAHTGSIGLHSSFNSRADKLCKNRLREIVTSMKQFDDKQKRQ